MYNGCRINSFSCCKQRNGSTRSFLGPYVVLLTIRGLKAKVARGAERFRECVGQL